MVGLKLKKFFPLVFLVLVCIVTIIFSDYYAKKEFRGKVGFVVSRIHVTPAGRCNLYDKSGNELILNSYTFFEPADFKVGDSIVKTSNSRTLNCYRKDSDGRSKIVKQYHPN